MLYLFPTFCFKSISCSISTKVYFKSDRCLVAYLPFWLYCQLWSEIYLGSYWWLTSPEGHRYHNLLWSIEATIFAVTPSTAILWAKYADFLTIWFEPNFDSKRAANFSWLVHLSPFIGILASWTLDGGMVRLAILI